MKFYLVNKTQEIINEGIYLQKAKWNDWFEYETLYSITIVLNAVKYLIGSTKIGAIDPKIVKVGEYESPLLQTNFRKLSKEYFSLGQSAEFYSNLNQLGDTIRETFLVNMNDIAYDISIYEKVKNEYITTHSLLRNISETLVINRFHRLSKGQETLIDFTLKYSYPLKNELLNKNDIEFVVNAKSLPPTNVHVIIGRNGVGKTHLLTDIAKTILIPTKAYDNGRLSYTSDEQIKCPISKVITVSFSIFDDLKILNEEEQKAKSNNEKSIRYINIGLNGTINEESKSELTESDKLAKLFYYYFNNCMINGKKDRWQDVIKILNTDCTFNNIKVSNLPNIFLNDTIDNKKYIIDFFSKLSSGHSIILLTLTGLIANVEEGSLVLLDEPETHLHPPLLSAFINALSQLLLLKNGLAIIATHSPVVLQEVPKSCVWKISRNNTIIKTERLEHETYGGNLNTLTRDVFGYEVNESGFHRELKKAALKYDSFDEAVQAFNSELGSEALGILKTEFFLKEIN